MIPPDMIPIDLSALPNSLLIAFLNDALNEVRRRKVTVTIELTGELVGSVKTPDRKRETNDE